MQPAARKMNHRYRKKEDDIEKCDLGALMQNIRRLQQFAEPVRWCWEVGASIARWKRPWLSVGCWLVSVVFCYLATSDTLFLLALLVLCGVSGLGMLQGSARRVCSKLKPGVGVSSEEGGQGQGTDVLQIHNTIAEFKQFISHLQQWTTQVRGHLDDLQAILVWEDAGTSIKIFCISLGTVLGVFLLPVRWSVIVGVSCVFIGNEEFYKVAVQYIEVLKSSSKEPVTEELVRQESAPKLEDGYLNHQDVPPERNQADAQSMWDFVVLQSSLSESSDSEGEEPEILDGGDFQDVIHRAHLPAPDKCVFYDAESEEDTGSDENLERKERISRTGQLKTRVVSKLAEFRNRNKALPTNCTLCNAVFHSVLKRRRYCRHCGNHFCSRCCHEKVPRSVFGATAPAASRETVVVCNICYNVLKKVSQEDSIQLSEAQVL
ncbi:Zinc finger FYVE-type containing 27 [Branchiostoma belcheri]|nr:Zinc finger FYVE-type containing 27 [Branchiostoma belcheri]